MCRPLRSDRVARLKWRCTGTYLRDAIIHLFYHHAVLPAILVLEAYLHWYTMHGCEEEDIREAIDTVADVVKAYVEMSR